MLSSAIIIPSVIFLLSAGGVGGLLLAAFYRRITVGSALDRQVELISASVAASIKQAGADNTNSRKRSVEDTLREAAEKQRAKAKKSVKPSLAARLRQANLGWSKITYYLICGATGLAAALAMLSTIRLSPLPAIGFGISVGLLLPHLYVSVRRNRRLKRFRAEFPSAVDIIVRGTKTGLPLVDCLKIVASETLEPVKGEFKTLVEDQMLGMPLGEAVQRLSERMPVAEASFFAIVIAIQSRTGGNLSEALGNLSMVLRERKKMQSKIKAMSGEAKASSGIIGVLPIIVAGLIYVTSPAYIALLFTTSTGNIVLAASAVWMLIGVLVMRKMINFDF
jgi:tight adherence protein B